MYWWGYNQPSNRDTWGFIYWLVVTGTMEFYDFPETVGNFIIPTDELIFFRGVPSGKLT